ncbi:MAG TPA: hypothetical protein VMB91_08130, partial [Solirubrobacteraceae bacterium]|nr:hypothetical protein [Solirubrobacteraceae bacterium]
MPATIAAIAIAVAALPATAAAKRHPCSEISVGLGPQTPNAETAPLEPSVTAMFAFLRRPAGPEDALPPLNPFDQDVGFQLRAYFPGEIRQIARDPDGERYFEIPGLERGITLPPARCLPAPLRKRRPQIVEERRKREAQPVYCIDALGPERPTYPQERCSAFAEVQTGASLIATVQSTTEVIELAPDGVATVRLRYRNGDVVTAPVAGNVFEFTPPQRPIEKLRALQRKLAREIQKGGIHGRGLEPLAKRLAAARARLVPSTVEWL